MKTVKIGIIGTGFIGPAHIEGIRRNPQLQIIALAEINEKLARDKAEIFNIPKYYGDWRKLLADKEVESVHICTPNNTHYEICKAALAAGKHIVCEKPLAMNSRESGELVKLAKKTDRVLAVDFNYRFYPLVQHCHDLVKSQKVGRIFSVFGTYLQDWLFLDTDYNWRLESGIGGSSRAVGDIGSHWCDLVQFITGKKIIKVMADINTVHPIRKKPKVQVDTFANKELTPADYIEIPIPTEDYAGVLLQFEDGVRGNVVISQVSAGRKNYNSFEIDGSKCSLLWDQENPNNLVIGYREKPNEVLIKDPSLLTGSAKTYAHYPGGHPEGYPDCIKNLCRNFYQFIQDGKDPKTKEADFPTFLDGHNEIVICEAIIESAKSQKWVEVDYGIPGK